jgi:hypothetical protein
MPETTKPKENSRPAANANNDFFNILWLQPFKYLHDQLL